MAFWHTKLLTKDSAKVLALIGVSPALIKKLAGQEVLACHQLGKVQPAQTDRPFVRALLGIGLSREQIYRYGVRNSTDESSVYELFKQHAPLAQRWGRRWHEITGCRKTTILVDDVIQEAMAGMLKACQMHLTNPRRGDKPFIPYAKLWVKKYCTEYINCTKSLLTTRDKEGGSVLHAAFVTMYDRPVIMQLDTAYYDEQRPFEVPDEANDPLAELIRDEEQDQQTHRLRSVLQQKCGSDAELVLFAFGCDSTLPTGQRVRLGEPATLAQISEAFHVTCSSAWSKLQSAGLPHPALQGQDAQKMLLVQSLLRIGVNADLLPA